MPPRRPDPPRLPEFGIAVIAVISLSDLMHHMRQAGRVAELASMQSYRDRYGLTE